jgi:hypothetical protein
METRENDLISQLFNPAGTLEILKPKIPPNTQEKPNLRSENNKSMQTQ